MSLSWEYRTEPHEGFWGTVNSHFNFCEEDYLVTPYCAELINTLTNFIYVFYALYGINGNRGRSDAFLRNFPWFGLLAVGIGSIIFHSTLKNYTQWCDDLSMLVASGAILQRVFTYNKSMTYTVVFAGLLWGALIAFSIWHCVTDELTMHSLVFGILIISVSIKTRAVIGDKISDPAVGDQVRKLATRSTLIFAIGYALWNVDNQYCHHLTRTKYSIGMPWSFMLELHGWWHILTGIGAYLGMALVEYLTSEDAGKPLEGRFAWPAELVVNGFGGHTSTKEKAK